MSAIDIAAIRAALSRAALLGESRGELPATATAITDDSRSVTPGALFIAVRGSERDGHDFLADAAARGAVAAMVEDPSRTELPALVVREGRRAAPLAAAVAYGEPAKSLRMLAVTGTNGKTTVVGILRHLFDTPAGTAGSIGTLGYLRGGAGTPLEESTGLTTPGPVELQRVLRGFVTAGVRTLAMEVSSHSLDQRRIEGLRFDAAVFTNLTRDHLDYHETMERYFEAKTRLIAHLGGEGTAVINADDPHWRRLPRAPHLVTFGRQSEADVIADAIHFTPRGSEWRLVARGQRHALKLPLIGDFNVDNALGAAAAAQALGMPLSDIARRLSRTPQVPGRLEVIHEKPTVLRDYAHTPDALERALAAVRPFTRRHLIVVFGAGGDRDRGKRPLMGAIAERNADYAILTSDNPRTEDPEAILDDIERGMRRTNHERQEDREAAIGRALAMVAGHAHDDVILLAGKGHETYQVRGTTRHPFDEQAIVAALTRGVA